MTRCVFDDLVGQERVASFLRAAVDERAREPRVPVRRAAGLRARRRPPSRSRAPSSATTTAAARAATCHRVRRGAHPDVHVIEPEGAAGYLVEQIARDHPRREPRADRGRRARSTSSRAPTCSTTPRPTRSSRRSRSRPTTSSSCCWRTRFDAVLPTIASRCQVVRFRRIPPSEAAALLVARDRRRRRRGARPRSRPPAAWSPRARDFLASPARREARARDPAHPQGPAVRDDLDVLEAAKELLAAVKAPLEDVKAAQAAEIAERVGLPRQGRRARRSRSGTSAS